MLYRITNAVAHSNHTVTVTWSDGVTADVDLSPVIAKGNVFTPLADAAYFVAKMRIATDRLGLEWPNRVDFSADGLRFRAFPEEAEAEFSFEKGGTDMKEPGLDNRHRDKNRPKAGEIQQKRGDTLNENLPKPIPEFSGKAKLSTMRKKTGKVSVEDVRRAAKKHK
jgi:hypothetical protein